MDLAMLDRMLLEQIISQEFYDWLIENGFTTAPASTQYHGSYEGGLYDHSEKVTCVLVNLTEQLNLKWQRPESPYIVGMFHDLCKIDQYEKSATFLGYNFRKDVLLTGHGEKSVMLLAQHMQLTEEEVMCIRYHMEGYNTGDWELLDEAVRKFPNIIFTHTADMIASKTME